MSDVDAALSALTVVAAQLAGALRSADPQRPVPHLQWTIGDLGAHVVSIVRAYTAAASGRSRVGPDLRRIDENNARLIAETSEASAPDLADALDAATASFVAANGRLPRDQTVSFYGDLTISAGVQARVLLGDLVLHSWDLATALDQKPSMDAESPRLAVDGSFAVLPHFVVPEAATGFSGTFEIRIRGNRPHFLVFTDGALTVTDDQPGRVDCRITADAMAYALMAFGRTSRWRPVIKREVVITGRRPWLANKLNTLVRTP